MKTKSFPKNIIRKIRRKLIKVTSDLYFLLINLTCPINNRLILIHFHTNRYECNLRAILEGLITENLNYKYYVVCASEHLDYFQKTVPSYITVIENTRKNLIPVLSRAKVIVKNNTPPLFNYKKRKGQYFLQTWHGSLGIKKAFGNNASIDNPLFKHNCSYDDIIFTNSRYEEHQFRVAGWSDKTEILFYGHPRSDILFRLPGDNNIMINTTYNIDNNVNIVLYAPTFRESISVEKNFEICHIDFLLLKNTLESRFGGRWMVMVRYHRNSRLHYSYFKKKLETLYPWVIDATFHIDVQELLLRAQVVITDYSSIIYDFTLTRKPGFIFAKDLQSYESIRGLGYPLEKTPFLIANSNEQLLENIVNFDNDVYIDKLNIFLKKVECIEDGQATYRVVSKIRELMEGIPLPDDVQSLLTPIDLEKNRYAYHVSKNDNTFQMD